MTQSAATTARQLAVAGQKVIDPADWTGAKMERSEGWIYNISEAEVADLDQAVRGVVSGGFDIMDITRENFPLPVFGPTLARAREELLNGRGFQLIRGFPVQRYGRAEAAAAFYGIGRYLGRAVSQNSKGHMLGHVKKMTDLDYNTNPNELPNKVNPAANRIGGRIAVRGMPR